MNPTPSDAFANPGANLVSMLRPMRAALVDASWGWQLQISPMRAVDAISAFATDDPRAETWLITNVRQGSWRDAEGPLKAADVADRLGLPIIERFGGGAVLVDRETAIVLLGVLNADRVTVTRVDGVVEAGDARAITDAVSRRDPALAAECRADVSLTVRRDRHVVVSVRTAAHARAVVATNLRHYMSAVLGQPVDTIAAPADAQLERLLSVSGHMSIRPIETDVLATSVDVGIGTDPNPAGPAPRSMIFDRPSGTWHDEP